MYSWSTVEGGEVTASPPRNPHSATAIKLNDYGNSDHLEGSVFWFHLPQVGQLLLVMRQALLVLELGEAAAQREYATAEVGVCRELAAEVFRWAAVKQVATAWSLSHIQLLSMQF